MVRALRSTSMSRLAVVLLAAASILAVPALAPASDPRGFTTRIDNPWFPLRPGTVLTYRGSKDGQPTLDLFRVTHRTRRINGVRCRIVSARLLSHGHLIERTQDYYVQDRRGRVWYFGEDTAELDARGRVTSREGTWHAGTDGARPGIFMPAHPRVGERHRQEYYRGHAEDQFRVLDLHARVKVPFGSFRNVLRTREWTRLEPAVIDNKYYVRGVGTVLEISRRGPFEVNRLVSVRRAG